MKKIRKIFCLSSFIFYLLPAQAQVVTTVPAFVTENSGAIDVIFDATQGTAGLSSYTGVVYAHTGIITSASLNDNDWKYVQSEWGENLPKLQLVSLGNDKYKLSLTPSIKAFYAVPEGEKILKLAFVFRSAEKVAGKDYYLEGKDLVSGAAKDIFVNVYEAGLNVSFALPAGHQSIRKGNTLEFIVNTSAAANIDLLINNAVVKSEQNAENLQYTHIFSAVGDFTVVARATENQQIVYDTLYVCVPKPATLAMRPAGVQDGINYGANDVTFVLYAPNKKNVFLVGDFNNWVLKNDFQLKKDGAFWWYKLENIDPTKLYKFQYVVDDTVRISDAYTELVLDPWSDDWINTATNVRYPDMPKYPAGKAAGTVSVFQINKPQYNWEAVNYTMPDKTSMVIYELLLRDFTQKQSLQGVLDRLDYLENLGVTAIELMPIQEFDGNSSWGYNPNHYFAPDKAYGSPVMYKKFIDECHKRGIAIILDVTMNHASGTHPFAKLYWNSQSNLTTPDNPFFNVYAPHPYSVLHDFNHSNPKVREHFKRMLKYWLTEYKIDGYRLDLSKGLTQTQSNEASAPAYDQSRIDILTEYFNAAKEANIDVMFILEHFCEWAEESVLAGKGMYMWKNANKEFSQSAMGYQDNSDFGKMDIQPRNWVGYPESHDEERNFFAAKAYGAGNLQIDSIARIARAPLNIAFATLVPGPKMIWQFGEIGYDVQTGESGSDTRMLEKPSGFVWFDNFAERQQAYIKSARIINLRKKFPQVFREGYLEKNMSVSDWANGRRIALWHNDLNVVVLGNFRTDASSGFPNFNKTGTWYELMSGATYNVTENNKNAEIILQGGEVKVFVDRPVASPTMPDIPAGVKYVENQTKISIFPTVTSDKIFISSPEEIQNVSVYNVQGVLLKNFKENVSQIDLSAFVKGLYFFEIETFTGKITAKIIKK